MKILVLAGALLANAPAVAQQTGPAPIAAPAGQPWRHANSGIAFPATLAGLPRAMVREFEAPQLDVVGNWGDPQTKELSVYVTRVTAGSLPVWFDRAVWAIETRGTYGTVTPGVATTPIRTPGASTDGGLIASWNTTGTYKGTAVAIVPLGQWLVKFRYSSTEGDGAAAAEAIRTAIAGLGWPATIPAAPAAQPVARCVDTLAFKGEAKNAPASMSSAILGAFGGLGAALPSGETPVYCREGDGRGQFGIYRPGGDAQRYLIALSDAGRGVIVGPGIGAAIDKTAKPSWSVDLAMPGRTINFAPQDRLPRPERALALLRTAPISSVTTWGDKPQVNINTGK